MSKRSEELYRYYVNYRDDSQDWRQNRDKHKKVYLGNQWESGVSKILKRRGQIDVVVNILRPLIRNRVSQLVAQKPSGQVYGVGKFDQTIAAVLQEFLDYIYYISDGQRVFRKVAMGQQREGVGYIVVAPDYKADFGRGELKFYHEPYRHVFFDKAAGRFGDLSDAPRIMVTHLMDKEQFLAAHPEHKNLSPEYFHINDEIYWTGKREHEESDEVDFPESQIDNPEYVREIDTYTRFWKEVPIIYHVDTGKVDVQDVNYTPTNEENQLMQEGIIKFVTAPIPRVKVEKTYGEKIYVASEELPISGYPVIRVVDEDTENALPLGEIDFNFGIQELENKLFSIIVHNAAMSSNYKLMIDFEKGNIRDKEKFLDEFAAPGSAVDVRIDQNGNFPVKEFIPKPLNAAYFPLFQSIIGLLERGTTTFSANLGNTAGSPDTFSATLQYGEWQNQNLIIPRDEMELGIQKAYDILLEWIPSFYDDYKVFDVMRDEEPGTQFINKPQFNEEAQVIETLHDITKLKSRFRIRMGSMKPANSVAYMMVFKELAASNPIFLKQLIDYLPVRDKMELKKQIDQVAQLSKVAEDQQNQLKMQSGMIEQLLKEQAELEAKDKVEEEIRKLEDARHKLKMAEDEAKHQKKMQKTKK